MKTTIYRGGGIGDRTGKQDESGKSKQDNSTLNQGNSIIDRTEKCICDNLCIEGVINPACPVCSAEGADVSACLGKKQTKRCICDPVVTEDGEHTSPDCPFYTIVSETAYERVVALFRALPKADSISKEMSEEELDVILAQINEAMTAFENLSDEDFTKFTEEHVNLLKAAAALNEAITGAQAVTLAETEIEVDGTTKTLADAISEASDGATLKITENFSITTEVTISNRNLTLDLNGKTIAYSGNDSAIVLENNAELTVVDGAGGGMLKATGINSAAIENNQDCTVNVLSGTLQNDSAYVIENNYGMLNISGGKVENTGDASAIRSRAGKITISGNAMVTSKVRLGRGTIDILNVPSGSPEIVLEISGGIVQNTKSGLDIFAVYFAYGTYVREDNLHEYYLKTGGEVGDVYPTVAIERWHGDVRQGGNSDLSVAGMMAQSGDKLKIVEDITTSTEMKIDNKSIIIDLNGKTIAFSGDGKTAFELKNGAGLTVMDSSGGGKIVVGSYNSKCIQNCPNGSVTISGGTVERTSSGGGVIYNSADGHVMISGGIVKASGDTGVITNIMGGRVTVSSGTVQASGGNAIWTGDNGYVHVSGGIVEATGSNGRAIYSTSNSKITVSGSAKVTSANTQPAGGTVYFTGVPNPAETALNIEGTAEISNTAEPEGYSVYFYPATVTKDNVRNYYKEAENTVVGRIYPVAAIVTAVKVSPATAVVKQGGSLQFSATVEGKNDPIGTVTWSVSGGMKAGTGISADGILTIAAGETAKTVIVKAVSKADTSKTGTAAVTVEAVQEEPPSGDGNVSGGSPSAGSSSDNSSNSAPSSDKPAFPTQMELKVEGSGTVTLPENAVEEAIREAKEAAYKTGGLNNGMALVINIGTGGTSSSGITVNLPKSVQETVISNQVENTVLVVNQPDIRVNLDLAAVTEINRQANADVSITATRMNHSSLTGNAGAVIGDRPVYELNAGYNGRQVTDLGAGTVSVTIPYTLTSGETAGGVCAVYVDKSGKVNYLTNSVYDAETSLLCFSTNHFSTYGISYKASEAFTDIADHWAREDIRFAVSRGLMYGTEAGRFSPDTAMTKGMLAMALGRLAGVDVSSYTKSSFTDVNADKMNQVTEETGVPHVDSNAECANSCQYLVLAVKPQYYQPVLQNIMNVVTPKHIIISIAPGITIAQLKESLGIDRRIVRAMPNTPALVGEGMTGVSYNPAQFSDEEKATIEEFFRSFGRVKMVEERLINAVACASGSSPAYVYMFIEALADSAVKYGLPRQDAYEMVAQTVLGSAKMVLETGMHPGALKDNVCSPGGTTIEGVSALEEYGFRNAIIKASDACYDKCKRL